jgi:hypothetical protein
MDQIIDAVMARGLHSDACRTHPLVGWLISRDPPEYPEKFVGRLVTGVPTTYVIVADVLADIHAALPPNLVRADRQPVDPPEVVEIWFAAP